VSSRRLSVPDGDLAHAVGPIATPPPEVEPPGTRAAAIERIAGRAVMRIGANTREKRIRSCLVLATITEPRGAKGRATTGASACRNQPLTSQARGEACGASPRPLTSNRSLMLTIAPIERTERLAGPGPLHRRPSASRHVRYRP